MQRLLRGLTLDLRPLRHRDFALLVGGRTVTLLGTQFTALAMPFQIFQLTHSAFANGLFGLAQVGPLLLFAFIGGALADARDRRRMVLLTEIGFTILAALLALNAFQARAALWAVFAIGAVQAGLYALQRPSVDAMLPRLVDRDEVVAAGAVTAAGQGLGMVAGPALAGAVIAFFGLPWAYIVDVGSFLCSLLLLPLMRAMPPALLDERVSVRRIGEGLAYAFGRKDLLGTYLVDLAAMIFGIPTALLPAIAAGFGGAGALGLMTSAGAVGGWLTFLSSGWTSRVHRQGLGVLAGAVAFGLFVTLFGLARSLPAAMLFLALAHAGDAVSGIFRMAIWNRSVPDRLRGRLASIELVSYSSGPLLGDFESGAVAAITGVRFSAVSGGVLCVVGCLACALALPAFRRYDNRRLPAESGS
ncbi:MAG: MFS transporter [Candidatus Dormibacteraeota bacterium]|nr:MFS transporter [Candidatus Dormibacteraeota bacterium]